MQIIISVGGRFHAFNLAQQLEKRGVLAQLITSYPKFEGAKYGIPRSKTSSVVIKEVVERGWKKLPAFLRAIYNPQYLIHEIYDRGARSRLRVADLFVGWSAFSLHTLRKAKEKGMRTVLDHGSSHIQYQDRILREEYEKFGVRFELAHPKIIEKELQEYQEADCIAIPSRFVKQTFIEYGIPEHKLIHVPYGVDLSQFKQIPKKDDMFRVVFAGGMSLRKGVHYLLQAFSELKLPNAELILIGSLNEEIKPFFKKYGVRYEIRNQYESTKIRTAKNRIHYLGHVPQGELYKYYSQGSVFVMMSIEEGLAMVIPQAMACGLPVICTTNTGGEDIVRDGKDGFVISIRDVATLKEKLTYLYQHPEARRVMGQSAKERVSGGFTWDDYGNKMIAAYERILKERRRALISLNQPKSA